MNHKIVNLYEFDRFRVDVREHQLRSGSKVISLAPKVFDTLLVLLENNGHTVNKGELMQRLWPDTFVADSSLAQNIFQLRKALGEGNSRAQYIETIPKRGYRFCADVRTLPVAEHEVLTLEPDSGKEDLIEQETLYADSVDLGRNSAASNRRKWLVLGLVGLGAVIAVFGSHRLWRSPSIESTATGADANSMAVLPFRYTRNTEAYREYVKGRYFWNKRTEEGFRKAIEHFRTAIEIDPAFALAHSGLADCYVLLASAGYGDTAPGENFERARAAARNALELDSTLAEAHTTLAMISSEYDGDWAEAEEAYRLAIALNPNYAAAHHWYALDLLAAGRFDQSVAEMKKALELDPLSLQVNLALGQVYFYLRRYDEAIAQLKQTLELDADHAASRIFLGQAYEQKRLFREAVAEFDRVLQRYENSLGALAARAHLHAKTNRRELAQKTLEDLVRRPNVRPVLICEFVAISTALGDKEQAFRWLEKLSGSHVKTIVIRLKFDPRLDELRADPRFKSYVQP